LHADTITVERRTAAFYAVLLALVIVDLFLLFWIFNPFTRVGSVDAPRRPVQDTTRVDDADKPSPFELSNWKAALNRPPRHPAKLRTASLVASRNRAR
jgi:hypothetical protein